MFREGLNRDVVLSQRERTEREKRQREVEKITKKQKYQTNVEIV